MGIRSKSVLVQDIGHKDGLFSFINKLVMIGFSSSVIKAYRIEDSKWLTYGFQGKLKCLDV